MDHLERSKVVPVQGVLKTGSASSESSYDTVASYWTQRTRTDDSNWPWVRRNWNQRRWPEFYKEFLHRQDWGNPFMTERASISSSKMEGSFSGTYSGGWYSRWSGPFLLAGFNSPLSLYSDANIAEETQIMFGLGGTAINRVRPGKPGLDLATALGELKKDGLPSVVGSLYGRARTAREVFRETGNEYLNLQFGWAPLVRDIQSLCEVVTNTRALLERHEQRLNRLLRRRYTFDRQIDTVEGLTKANSLNGAYDRAPAMPYSTTFLSTRSTVNPVIEITRTVVKSHFSGGFRFYYPEVSEALDALREYEDHANALLGTRLDPEVLWNLQPWSWLADWFFNFGDVVGNISAITADGLVMQYGYMMRHTTVEKEISFPLGLAWRSTTSGYAGQERVPLVIRMDYERKTRVHASPFGFGLSPESFTDSQWAILAALGISRV